MENKIGIVQKEKRIKVTDDWFPCYNNNEIKLKISLNRFNNYYVKFTASGADDFILEMEKDCGDFKEAVLTYIEFEIIFDKIQNGVNKEYFYKLGFRRF